MALPGAAGVAVRYGLAVGTVAIAHFVILATWRYIGPALTSVFLLAVILASLYGGRGPGLVATVAAALDLNFAFTRPYYSFALIFEDFIWLAVFVAVALLTSSLQVRRRQAEDSLRRAHRELEDRVRQRTAELVRSQEQFSLLVNGVADQAFFMLDSGRRVASWNPGAARLLGYGAADIVGRHVSVVLGPAAGTGTGRASPVAVRCRCGVVLGRPARGPGWVARRDGSRFWAGIVLTALRDESDRPRGYALLLRDVTERRSLERDVLEAGERERQRIGHDLHDGLGQELTGIAMLATALAERLGGPPAGDPDAPGDSDDPVPALGGGGRRGGRGGRADPHVHPSHPRPRPRPVPRRP